MNFSPNQLNTYVLNRYILWERGDVNFLFLFIFFFSEEEEGSLGRGWVDFGHWLREQTGLMMAHKKKISRFQISERFLSLRHDSQRPGFAYSKVLNEDTQ